MVSGPGRLLWLRLHPRREFPPAQESRAAPRLAIAMLRGVARAGAPPSSVVTKVLPIASAVVSNIAHRIHLDHLQRIGRAESRHSFPAARFPSALSGRMWQAASGRKSSVLPPE